MKVTSEQMEDEGRVPVFDLCYFFTILFAWLCSVFIPCFLRIFRANSVIYRCLEELAQKSEKHGINTKQTQANKIVQK